ncbi:MAG: hypothetical protein KBA53_03955 [Thermoclostridium sp.]|nr:hypothetical protein [Thermoclostridium sp.]
MVNETIRHFTYYVKRMFKFYDLKAPYVPQVLFVLLLLVSFGLRLVAQPVLVNMSIYQQQWVIPYLEGLTSATMTDPAAMNGLMLQIITSDEFRQFFTEFMKASGVLLIQQVLLLVLLFFYLGAYLTDLETKTPAATQYFKKFFKSFPRFLGFNVIYYTLIVIVLMILSFLLSFIMLILPIASGLLPIAWFLIQVIFIFKDVALLDTRVGILKNFSLAWKLSAGNRSMIGVNTFFLESLTMILFLLPIITIVQESSHITLTIFIVSFIEVIALLVRQRLIALMYFDRTRIIREEEPDAD